MISVLRFWFFCLLSTVTDIFWPAVVCPKPLKNNKKKLTSQKQQLAAKKKSVSTGITGVFWRGGGDKAKALFKRPVIYKGVRAMHATCHSLLFSHGIGGENKTVAHHQGEMYIVIREQKGEGQI